MSVAPSHVGENVAGAGRGCRPDNGTGGFYSAEIRPKLESRSLVGVQQDDVVITAGSVLETRIPVARSCRSATSAIAYYALLAVRCWEVLAAVTVKQYSLFVRNCFHREGEGHPPDRNLAATVSGGLHASRDSFYRTARAERQYRPGVIPLALLPRRCPVCQNETIIGHGCRLRQSHDSRRESICVRRGVCQPCGKTFTVLPEWLALSARYTLNCAAGESVEQAAPHCKDPTRLPDASTLRRWAQRRLLSVCSWLMAGAWGKHFLRTPTILAWDFGAACRILRIEASSP